MREFPKFVYELNYGISWVQTPVCCGCGYDQYYHLNMEIKQLIIILEWTIHFHQEYYRTSKEHYHRINISCHLVGVKLKYKWKLPSIVINDSISWFHQFIQQHLPKGKKVDLWESNIIDSSHIWAINHKVQIMNYSTAY